MPSLELSQEFELRQMTCWEFKWKSNRTSYNRYLTTILHAGLTHLTLSLQWQLILTNWYSEGENEILKLI